MIGIFSITASLLYAIWVVNRPLVSYPNSEDKNQPDDDDPRFSKRADETRK